MAGKATLKAELAFAYKMQMCSAQKVAYWDTTFSLQLNKQGGKIEKCKISGLTLSNFVKSTWCEKLREDLG